MTLKNAYKPFNNPNPVRRSNSQKGGSSKRDSKEKRWRQVRPRELQKKRRKLLGGRISVGEKRLEEINRSEKEKNR